MENSQRIGRAAVEAAFGQAGFRLESADEIRTEFREYEEERSQRVSDSLLRLARLRRRSAEVIDRFGGTSTTCGKRRFTGSPTYSSESWNPSPTSFACHSSGGVIPSGV
jgi:hypothetical protein